MTATIYFRTKDTTVTIGSIAEQSGIVSDIVVGGGEKAEAEEDAIDGTNYAYIGSPAKATIEFDFVQGTSYNIVEMVYGPETTSGSPISHTLVWNGAGSAKTITISNTRASNGQIMTVTMTDVEGISAPITYRKGQSVIRSFKGQTAAQNITEVVTEAT